MNAFVGIKARTPYTASVTSILYHYTSYDALIQIVKSGVLWASSIAYLNDGSEFAHAIDRFRHYIFRKVLPDSPRDRVAHKLLAALRSAEERIVVASFSKNGDSLNQWRAYCPMANGVSIGIP